MYLGFSGADLANLLREASLCALKDYQLWKSQQAVNTDTAIPAAAVTRPLINRLHFETAFSNTRASVPLEERRKFNYVKELIQENKGALEALRLAKEKVLH